MQATLALNPVGKKAKRQKLFSAGAEVENLPIGILALNYELLQ